MRRHAFHPLLGVLVSVLAACGGSSLPSSTLLVAVEDGQPGPAHSLSGQQLEPGIELLALENASLRGEPSTSATVLAVVPRDATLKLLEGVPWDGFYKVSFAGIEGWSYGAHYTESSAVMSAQQALTASEILTRAATVEGFSYWWGHGVWRPGSTNYGSCSGSCGNCSHSGPYGADCSGFVAKAWQVPSTNIEYTVNSHPYSTADFYGTTIGWDPVARGSLRPGDALVYRSGGEGHIFIYASGDPWGAMSTYECKGCASGCGRGYRASVGSAYKAIRRRGLTGSPTPATRFDNGGKWVSGLGGPTWAGVGDFNGDGKDDIAWYEAWNSASITVLLSTGSTLTYGGKWVSGLGAPTWAGVGDFNGDGRDDIAWYEDWNSASVTVLLSTGSSLAYGGKWVSGLGAPDWAGVGDFNGDGRADLAWYEAWNDASVTLLLSGGSSLSYWGKWVSGLGRPDWAGVGDFNGDGKADLAWYEAWNSASVTLLLSSGSSLAYGGKWISGLGGPDWAGVGDFTGDGKVDLAWYEAWNGASITMLPSTGSALAYGGKWISGWGRPDWAAVGDFDGDKRMDIAWYEIWNNTSVSFALAR